MKVLRKLKCKECESTEDLHEIQHPAGWTYCLCGKCVEEKQNEDQSTSSKK